MNDSKKNLPVFAKGGFNVRKQEPIGFASSHAEALVVAGEHVKPISGHANGGQWINTLVGVDLESDDEGSYYVAKREIR